MHSFMIPPFIANDFIIPPPMLPVDQTFGFDCFSVASTSAAQEFSILDFVLTDEELLHFGFPSAEPSFKATKRAYAPLSNESPLFVVDCEMCVTESGISEVTRVSILTEKGDVVLDTLVQPPHRITDYVTEYSGITADMMDGVTTMLHDVHDAIDAVLPADAILVGHSLNVDLKALKLTHPYCIDTSLEFNHSGNPMLRSKLRDLCEVYLGRQIQKGRGGHCSIEDCAATMDLAVLKLSKDIQFGNVARGFKLETFTAQPKKRLLIGRAPAHYRPKRCACCAGPMRVDCPSIETCSCWWREDVNEICVRCIASEMQQQQ